MSIQTAKTAGFCFGVKRAIQLAEKTAKTKKKVYTLGPLIHNPQEVLRLEKNGIKVVKSPWHIKKNTIVVRTHGIPEQLREKLEEKKFDVVDATCPFVKRAQDFVKRLVKENRQVVIVGEKVHPEVIALVSYGHENCYVLENENDARKIKLSNKIGVVSQTTQTPENFNRIIKTLRKSVKDIIVFNTICRATIDRQQEAKNIAEKVNVMIVVGGKNSGNTTRLYDICKKNTKSYHIESAKEIKSSWFNKANKIGITAGASTPDWIIKEVENKIKYIKGAA